MYKSSLILKLGIAFSVFFTVIIAFLSSANIFIAQSKLLEAEQEKVETIVNTLMPVLAVNLSFGFKESITEILESLPTTNPNIIGTRIVRPDGAPAYSFFSRKEYNDIFLHRSDNLIYQSEEIIDPFTGERAGTLLVAYSNENYHKLLREYYSFLTVSIGISIFIFVFFILYFKHQLSPLKHLTERLETFNPEDDEYVLPQSKGNDEIAIITQAARTMMGKIKEYTAQLREINAHLEDRVQDELAKNREKDEMLIRQSRQAAMGEMIGNIAHQWRQPLNALGLTIQDIEEAYEFGEVTPEYMKKSVTKSMRLVNHMSDTIDDFRNFFRPNKEMLDFSLASSIKSALEIIGASLKNNGIHTETDLDERLFLNGFPNEFSQVILNILNNAKDAIKEQGVRHGLVRIVSVPDEAGENAIVTIADNGGGIPPTIIEKIFEPYFTTKEQGKGTGIGLYMSKMIIEKNMKGAIGASNDGQGAVFRLILPLRYIKDPTPLQGETL